jgi:hypothetical protein
MYIQPVSTADNPARANRQLALTAAATFDSRVPAPHRGCRRARRATRLEVPPPSIEYEIYRWVDQNPPQLYRGGA